MDMPPPVLGGLYVVAFAHVDDSIHFEQRKTLNVGGEWLGRVPNLAICEDFDSGEFLLQHCSEDWEPLGIAGGYNTVEEARARAEQSYHGISAKWITNPVGKDQARVEYEAELKAEACSFCGRMVYEVTAMVGEEVRICNHCIDKFHGLIHERDQDA